MSTESDLLRAIRDNPDEDTPRLMFADYLDEEGHAPRAEFIRVQVERSQLPEGDAHRRELEDRAHELLAEHEADWLGVAPAEAEELVGWRFERGFLDSVNASPVFMRTVGTNLLAAHPVRRWHVTSGTENFPADMKEAGQRGWAARLDALDLSEWYPTLGEITGSLGRNSNFERLRELDLTRRGPLDPVPDIVEFVPFRDQLKVFRCGLTGYDGRLDQQAFVAALGKNCHLEELAVPGAMLTDADVRDLITSGVLASLTSLDLRNNQIAGEGWNAFRAARFRLRELDVRGTQLGGTVLGPLLGCAALTELRRLRINGTGLTEPSVRALAASRFWSQAEGLWIEQGAVWDNGYDDYDDAGAAPPAEQATASLDPLFAAAKGPSNLRVLDVTGNNVRDTGVALLCGAAWAGSLVDLNLSQNNLTDEALRHIAGSGRFKNLRALHLNNNNGDESITDAGLRALADCADLANLRVLSLNNNTRVTAAGVEAVLNSPHFRLTELHLANCQLKSQVIDVFTASPRTARLEQLFLPGNDNLSDTALSKLAESEHLSPLTVLELRHVGVGEEVRAAFIARLGRRFRG